MLLHNQVENDHRKQSQNQGRHHDRPVVGKLAYPVIHLHDQGCFFCGAQEQVSQKEVIPDPHGIENHQRGSYGAKQRKHDNPEGLEHSRTVNLPCLFQFLRYGIHKAPVHEVGKGALVAVQEDHTAIGIDQMKIPHDNEKRKHRCLQRHHETDDKIPAHKFREFVVSSGNSVSSHGTKDNDEYDGTDRYQQRISEIPPEIHGSQCLAVIIESPRYQRCGHPQTPVPDNKRTEER